MSHELIYKCNKGQIKRHRAFTQKASCFYPKGIVLLKTRQRWAFSLGVKGFTFAKGETF